MQLEDQEARRGRGSRRWSRDLPWTCASKVLGLRSSPGVEALLEVLGRGREKRCALAALAALVGAPLAGAPDRAGCWARAGCTSGGLARRKASARSCSFVTAGSSASMLLVGAIEGVLLEDAAVPRPAPR